MTLDSQDGLKTGKRRVDLQFHCVILLFVIVIGMLIKQRGAVGRAASRRVYSFSVTSSDFPHKPTRPYNSPRVMNWL